MRIFKKTYYLFSTIVAIFTNSKFLKMKKIFIPVFASVLFLTSCSKEALTVKNADESGLDDKGIHALEATGSAVVLPGYKLYSIPEGSHTSDKNSTQYFSVRDMKFSVVFDQSAIYTTRDPINQNDINMLYGFSEIPHHQINSARFGWRYSNNTLNLFAYVYVRGVRQTKFIATVLPLAETKCRIRISGSTYIFTVNDIHQVVMPRGLTSSSSLGYKLYPYFGGTETAPQTIDIQIKDM